MQQICAFQWASANRIITEDLAQLPADRWMACSYEALTDDAEGTVRQLCEFAGIGMDDRFLAYLRTPLPLSRLTHTKPDAEKWRKNEADILSVLDQLSEIQPRCEQIIRSSSSGG